MHSSAKQRWQRAIQPALSLVAFGAVLYAVDRLLQEYHWREIVQALEAVPFLYRVAALPVAAAGYLARVGCDYIAFRYVRRPLPLREMLIPSFITFAVSNNAPASVITAGGLRYRLYQPHGLSAADATAVAAFNVVTYVLGLFVVSGVGLLIQPPPAPIFRLSGRVLGALLLSMSAAYLIAARMRGRPIKLLRWTIPLPAFELAQKRHEEGEERNARAGREQDVQRSARQQPIGN